MGQGRGARLPAASGGRILSLPTPPAPAPPPPHPWAPSPARFPPTPRQAVAPFIDPVTKQKIFFIDKGAKEKAEMEDR
jgi:hypothetical protein